MSTLAPPNATSEQIAVSDELDLLIPPPMSAPKKFIVSMLIVAATIGVVVAFNSGYVQPSAFGADDFLPSEVSHVDHENGTFAVVVNLRNQSSRTVRLTDVNVDTPGAELVAVTLEAPRLQHPFVNGAAMYTIGPPTDSGLATALPAEVEPTDRFEGYADDEYLLTLWLRPTSCETLAENWGSIEVSVDFGDGAFPPASQTTRFDRPLWTSAGRLDGWTRIWDGQEWLSSNGPLEAACEALR